MSAFDRVAEHFDHFVDAQIDAESFRVADVFGALFIADFGMIDQKIDLAGEVGGAACPIQIGRMPGEKARRGFFAVGDDGYEPASDRFDAGNGFDLGIGRVRIQIAVMDDIDQFFLRMKGYDGRVWQFFAEFFQFGF